MELKVFIIFSLSIISIGNCALLGAKECTYGPAYWCSSIPNAKQCNAVDHCIQTVWERESLPEDNDDVCSICKEMVKEARDQLLSNETQDEIRQVFEGSCKLIPVTIIQTECLKFSDQFIPELIDTLASQMNPQVVCATAGLCNSAHIDLLLADYHKNLPKATEVKKDTPRDCNDCKSFITDIVSKVKSLPRSQVLNQILTICGRFGSLSDGCMSLVQSNFNFIYDFLKNGLHPSEVCDVFGMCEKLYGKNVITAVRTEDEPCDFCIAIVNHWKDNLLSNTTKGEVKEILEGICDHTGNFKQECHSLIDQYFDVFYAMLTEIGAKEICETFGLCGPNALFKNDVSVWTIMEMRPEDHLALDMDPLNPSHGFTGRDEANSYNDIHLPRVSLTKSDISIVNLGENGILNHIRKPSLVLKSDECVMCEFVFHFLQNVLNDAQTREEIKNDVEKVCTMFPASIVEECQDYIDAYGDQIIQLLALEIDPSTICPMLHLCPAISTTESMTGDSTCILCEYVMSELDQILADKSNKAAVKKTVEGVCVLLPKSIRSECKYFIDLYIDQIVDLIINDVTPQQICAQIGLCPKSNVDLVIDPSLVQLPVSRLFLPQIMIEEKPKLEDSSTVQSNECILCEFIISKIDSTLVTNATEEEIRKMIDRVCLLLPNTLKNDCLGFMDEYSKALVELIVHQMDPVKICTELNLCKNQFLIEGMFKAEVSYPPADDCLICEKISGFVNKQLKRGDVFVDVVKDVKVNVCNLMSSKTEAKCDDFIVKYNDFLIKLLEEFDQPKGVCQFLTACPRVAFTRLLGADKCTRGPGYWCQSKLHAESCKAMDHCMEKIWMGVAPDF